MNKVVLPYKVSRLIDDILRGTLSRGNVLPHILLVGPPGIGKTTIASYIAREMGVDFVKVIGGAITQPKDIIGILLKLSYGSVLFIDEIHRIPSAVEELLYPALDNFSLDMIIGKGKVKSIALQPFTIIGATTMEEKISPPLRSRFSLIIQLDGYEKQDLLEMIALYSENLIFDEKAKEYLIFVSRGNPRRLVLLIERLKDFVSIRQIDVVKVSHIEELLDIIDYDTRYGLDRRERRYLMALANGFNGGPAGVRSLAGVLGESVRVLQEIVEPPLIADGFIVLTPRGRKLTEKGWSFVEDESSAS